MGLRLDRRSRPGGRSVDKNTGMRILQIERSLYRNLPVCWRTGGAKKKMAFNMRALEAQRRLGIGGFILRAGRNPADRKISSGAEEIAADFGAAKDDRAGRFEIVTELNAAPDLSVDTV
jgi:hypothetical protein